MVKIASLIPQVTRDSRLKSCSAFGAALLIPKGPLTRHEVDVGEDNTVQSVCDTVYFLI